MTKSKSKNVAIKADKVEISAQKTTINNNLAYQPPKPRLGLTKIEEIRKGSSSKENVEKELGILSTNMEYQSKAGKTYCVFGTVLPDIDQLIERVKEGGYDVIKLDKNTILVRW